MLGLAGTDKMFVFFLIDFTHLSVSDTEELEFRA